jgi:long-subunit fatty acid transport protein
MNKIKIFVVLCLVSTVAFAGGYRVSTQSNKQLAMGHTGVAVVNSADVLFFNPAGIVHLENKLNISAGGFGVFSDVQFQSQEFGTMAETNSPTGTPIYLYATYKVSEDFGELGTVPRSRAEMRARKSPLPDASCGTDAIVGREREVCVVFTDQRYFTLTHLAMTKNARS